MKTLDSFLSEHHIELQKLVPGDSNPRLSVAGKHYRAFLASEDKSYSLYITALAPAPSGPSLHEIISALVLDCASVSSPISPAGLDGELNCEYSLAPEEAARRREAYLKRLEGLKHFIGEEATKELLTRVAL